MVKSFRFNKLQINSIINEENKHTNVLTESQESKSIDAAKKLAMQHGLSYEEADKLVRHDIRHGFPFFSHNPKGGKFILGVTRMLLDDQIQDAQTQNNLNTTLKYVASDAHYNEYDRNLNGLSAQDVIQRFAKNVEMDMERDRNEVNSMQFEGNSLYDIVRIDSFEQACEYNKYTYKGSPWCLTYSKGNYDSYTSDGINQIYFCLKKGFESTPPQVGENCPLDEYGLSMISVIVNENGSLAFCTSRWNHENDGNDNIMDTKQISQVIGMNFYEVFKPNNKWKEMVENAMQRLRNGEDPYDVFDECDDFYNGFAVVCLNEKWNWLTEDGSLLSPDQWFDDCGDFENGFARVRLNGKDNWIKTDGSFLVDKPISQWFDFCDNFENGFARVKLNEKLNLIDTKGNLFRGDFTSFDQWFDWCGNFENGFVKVKLNGKCNLIDAEGNPLWKKPIDQWFDFCDNFENGFVRVKLNGKLNFIDTKGSLVWKKPIDQWFDRCGYFDNGLAAVKLNRKCNFIDTKGNLVWEKPIDQWFDDCEQFKNGFAKVELNHKYNFIDTRGNLVWEKPIDQWFDGYNYFDNGFAKVELNHKYNWINTEGNLLSPNQWFDSCEQFKNSFAKVELNHKYNFIDTRGNLLSPNQWFDWCYYFEDGLAMIDLNGKLYRIDIEGNLYDSKTKEPLGINVKTMNKQNESIKFKKHQVDYMINESKRVQLNERTSSVVYHWCSPETAWKILQSNRFSLMSTLFKGSESKLVGTSFKRMYYMSMTRNSKIGMGGYAGSGSHRVRLTLDGDRLNSRFHIKALDYWGQGGKNFRMSGKMRDDGLIYKDDSMTEAEDRLYSSKPFVDNALSYIKHIDICFDYDKVGEEYSSTLNTIYNIMLNAASITTLYKTFADFNSSRNAVDGDGFYEIMRNKSGSTDYISTSMKRNSIPSRFLASCVYLVNFPYGSIDDCMRTLREYGLEKYSQMVAKELKNNSSYYSSYIFAEPKYWDGKMVSRVLGNEDVGILSNIMLGNGAQSMDREYLSKGYQIITDFCKEHRLNNFDDIKDYFKELVSDTSDSLEMKNSHHTVGLTCAQVNHDNTWYVCVEPSVDLYLNVFPNGKTQLQYLLDDIMNNVSSISHKSQNDKLFLNYIKRLLKNPTVQEVFDLCTKLRDLGYSDIDDEYYKPFISVFHFNYEDIRWGVLSDWGFSKDGLRFYLKDASQKEKIIKKWNNS